MYYSSLPHKDEFSKWWFWCIGTDNDKLLSKWYWHDPKKWTYKYPVLTFQAALTLVEERSAGALSCQIESQHKYPEYFWIPKKLWITPRSLFVVFLLSSPLPLFSPRLPCSPFLPAEPSQTALNERCLNRAHRQSINCALSLVAGCLSQTLLDGASDGEGGAIREHLRVYLSRKTQLEGAEIG